jgi:hypothetical protein
MLRGWVGMTGPVILGARAARPYHYAPSQSSGFPMLPL